MAKYSYFNLVFIAAILTVSCRAGNTFNDNGSSSVSDTTAIVTGAEQTNVIIEALKGKRVGVVANQTSIAHGRHIVDILVSNQIEVVRVFAPEHGFRGETGPGDNVNSGRDHKTGLQVISLYGSRKRPEKSDMEGIDCIIFDIQDVGARFYTYISTLHYVMEACEEFGVEVIVFDRPNPNGFYIDGPVLDPAFSSFVGVAPIPVVHGLTVGEYALMVNGEKWLRSKKSCELRVIKMLNYTHSKPYSLPVRPSPNLPVMESIYLYPSLCFFEGARVSVGRGTQYPFMVAGFPGYKSGTLKFTPVDIPGVIKDPPYENVECTGKDMRNQVNGIRKEKRLMIEWIIDFYRDYPDKDKFFNDFFDKLAGTDTLRKQIIAGKDVTEIRAGWKRELDAYKLLRSKYLLYPD